mgnify:CR=1 FL=1
MMEFLKNLFGKSVDIEEILAQGATINDVRTVNEYRNGHGKKSINIPLNTLEANLKKIKQYDQPIIACCASGMRSGRAASILKSKGIEAYNGGAWQNVDKFI